MNTAEFDYKLPEELIAHRPAAERDASRLMVVKRSSGQVTHTNFRDILAFLPEQSSLFRNTAKVLPARLMGKTSGGGRAECLLVRPAGDPGQYWCLVKPGRKLKAGAVIHLEAGPRALVAEVDPDGLRRLQFSELGPHTSVTELAEAKGQLPLPPYINRDGGALPEDRTRYQTVYADAQKPVAAAAPTAGLHFTPELLQAVSQAGHDWHDLTLHIGLGTFQPIKSDVIEAHAMHREAYEVPHPSLSVLRAPGTRPRIAVGTTSLRAMEHTLRALPGDWPKGKPWLSEADLFLYPPCAFLATDGLLTNFHLPRSTLLCLVSGFLRPGSTEGVAWLHELYREAISRQYRFFSYGDAMLIL
jgi:S-adenosylmethionine:tRNA ribosyltransferase-isomerase